MLDLVAAGTRLFHLVPMSGGRWWLSTTGLVPLVAGESFVEAGMSWLVVRVGLKKEVGYKQTRR